MARLLEELRHVFEQLILDFGYPAIALALILENIMPALPAEMIVPFAGFMVAEGHLSFVGVVIASTTGFMLGTLILYWVGTLFSEAFLRRLLQRYGRYILLTENDLDTALAIFDRYGALAVCFGRLFPVARTVISVPAGLRRMPLGRFLLFSGIGATSWSIIWTAIGFVLGENWEVVIGYVQDYERIMFMVTGLVILAFFLYRLRFR